jgi:hypothetical protein
MAAPATGNINSIRPHCAAPSRSRSGMAKWRLSTIWCAAVDGREGKIDRFQRIISIEGEVDAVLRDRPNARCTRALDATSAVITKIESHGRTAPAAQTALTTPVPPQIGVRVFDVMHDILVRLSGSDEGAPGAADPGNAELAHTYFAKASRPAR